jgi:hypothetical protein
MVVRDSGLLSMMTELSVVRVVEVVNVMGVGKVVRVKQEGNTHCSSSLRSSS